MNAVFANRRDAGQKLARLLVAHANKSDVIVLVLPRGGVPVASGQAIARLKHQVDKFTCLIAPDALGAVGFWYEDFSQTTDKEVCDLLNGQSCQNYAGSC